MLDKTKGSRYSVAMKCAVKVFSLIFSVVLIYFSQGASAAASTKDDCIARYQKKAKCQVATKAKVKSVLIWSASIAALLFVFMSIYTSFSTQQARLTQALMANFPRELLIAVGMEDLDWSSVLGYFGLIFRFCQICLAVQAANYGFGLVSIEETEWTADFLLSKPVSRTKIMTSKLLAALTGLIITILSSGPSVFCASPYSPRGRSIRPGRW